MGRASAYCRRFDDAADRMLYLDSEDSKLASLTMIRFGATVEGTVSFNCFDRPRLDSELSARMVLLVDFFRRMRIAYANAGGLHRLS